MSAQSLTSVGANRNMYLVALVLGLFLLFLVLLDQGQMLSLVQGKVAYAQNLVHELVHDARHVSAVPCH